jgi:hypothetical protein
LRLVTSRPGSQVLYGVVWAAQTVKNILQQCYGDKSAVTDELVDKILGPGLLPGAVDVFLDFISYSGGPLPEEQLAAVQVPVSILWGAHPHASCLKEKRTACPCCF